MALSFLYCTQDDVRKQIRGLDISDMPSSIFDDIDDSYIQWAQRDVDSFCGTNFDATETEEFYDGSGGKTMILNHKPVREILNVTLYIIPSAQWVQFRRWFYTNPVDQLGIKVCRFGGVEPKDSTINPLEANYIYPTGLGFANEDATPANQTASFSSSEEQYGKSDLFINARLGTLTIPPRILFLEGQGTPFWNYTWLRSGIGGQNVRVKYIYGYSDPNQVDPLTESTEGNLPREITDATAGLAAKYVLIDKGIFTGSGASSVSVDGVSRSFGEMPYSGYIKHLEEKAKRILSRYKRISV